MLLTLAAGLPKTILNAFSWAKCRCDRTELRYDINKRIKIVLQIHSKLLYKDEDPASIGMRQNSVQFVLLFSHDDVIKWKHFPRYCPFVRGIHRSRVNSPHKGQWRGALMFPLICVWINDWAHNCEAADLRRYRANYDVTVMKLDK